MFVDSKWSPKTCLTWNIYVKITNVNQVLIMITFPASSIFGWERDRTCRRKIWILIMRQLFSVVNDIAQTFRPLAETEIAHRCQSAGESGCLKNSGRKSFCQKEGYEIFLFGHWWWQLYLDWNYIVKIGGTKWVRYCLEAIICKQTGIQQKLLSL